MTCVSLEKTLKYLKILESLRSENGVNKTVHYNCNTTILLKRELRTPSHFIFRNFAKYLRKVFLNPIE